jgi:hypothetical protein
MSISSVANPPTSKPSLLKKIVTKCQNCCQDKKVQKVVVGIFCAIIGGLVGALVGSIIGATPIIVGAVVGGLVGGMAYLATKSVLHVIKMQGYPAHAHAKSSKGNNKKPLSAWGTKDWGSDENLGIFKEVIREHFSKKPWFEAWKTHKGFKKDFEATEYLFGKGIRKVPSSFGEAQELIRISKAYPELKGEDFLIRVHAEGLYQRQIPELVRQDLLEYPKKGLRKQLKAETETIRGLDLADSLGIDLKNLGSFATDLKDQRLDKDLTSATLQLDGKNKHTLYIRLKEPYCFYDPFSKKFGGLHEKFASKDKFIEKLCENLKCYRSKWRLSKPLETGTLKFYR